MKTQILEINEQSLAVCKQEIQNGGLVAFPTETVYGLGANAFDTQAVDNIFITKGRPNDNPLIVHIHKDYDLMQLVSYIPDYAKKLAEVFLPGPLTMVYPSKGVVSPSVSCGLNTLAIRIPAHEGAQAFLKFVNLPIAAPSANISKHVSPVSAQHVFDDFNGKIPYILEGGKCSGGIESTVLDCTGDEPCILRSGLITQEMIASVVGVCNVYVPKTGEKVKSPGMKYKHYSPRCETMLFSYQDRFDAKQAYQEAQTNGKSVYLLCDEETGLELNVPNWLNLGANELQIASNLYEKLREGELIADLIIGIAPQKQNGVMVGIMNRFSKACKSE